MEPPHTIRCSNEDGEEEIEVSAQQGGKGAEHQKVHSLWPASKSSRCPSKMMLSPSKRILLLQLGNFSPSLIFYPLSPLLSLPCSSLLRPSSAPFPAWSSIAAVSFPCLRIPSAILVPSYKSSPASPISDAIPPDFQISEPQESAPASARDKGMQAQPPALAPPSIKAKKTSASKLKKRQCDPLASYQPFHPLSSMCFIVPLLSAANMLSAVPISIGSAPLVLPVFPRSVYSLLVPPLSRTIVISRLTIWSVRWKKQRKLRKKMKGSMAKDGEKEEEIAGRAEKVILAQLCPTSCKPPTPVTRIPCLFYSLLWSFMIMSCFKCPRRSCCLHISPPVDDLSQPPALFLPSPPLSLSF